MKPGVIPAAVALMMLTSCIGEYYGRCGVWLEFIFDHNMEYIDSFPSRVGTVDIFLFDETGKFLFTRHADRADLHGANRMHLGGLPRGNYRILTLGELSNCFSFTDMNGAGFIAGVTTIEEAELRLLHTGTVVHEFPDLWFGPAVDIACRAGRSVWPVSLLRETNRFHITLGSTGPRTHASPCTVEIAAPEEGAYDYRNYPLTPGLLLYRPYYISNHDGSSTNAVINTMRLFESERGGYRLVVRDGETGDKLWDYDLIRLLEGSKPASRPDGTALPLQEYLDRRGEWEVEILYDDTPDDGFVAARVSVNGWIVWEYGMGI